MINPDRKFGGVMDAQEWPTADVDMEALYLLTLGETPLGRQAFSASSPIYVFTAQWTWLIAGNDLDQGVEGRNRGDRYRIDAAIKDELRRSSFPFAAEKKVTTVDSNNLVVRTPFDPKEYIYWQALQFTKRSDKASGLIYGVATAYITGITAAIAD